MTILSAHFSALIWRLATAITRLICVRAKKRMALRRWRRIIWI